MARLALVATVSTGIAVTLHVSATNTSFLSPETKTYSLELSLPLSDTLLAREPAAMDIAMGALSPNNAVRYRAIFAAQKKGDWLKADWLLPTLTDNRLLGHVLADRYQRGRGKPEELRAWLKAYGDLPEAETIYAAARRQSQKNAAALPVPGKRDVPAAGYEPDSGADFAVEIKTDILPQGTRAGDLANAINHALRRNDPTAARDLLVAAQGKEPLAGTVAADAEAAIAASFFYMGEREQAHALAGAAADARQPLGLWIQGLIAWEQSDYALAAKSFMKLASHPAIDAGNRAAAHFWAYRALTRGHDPKAARRELELAASQPPSFYGILAAQLVNPGSGDSGGSEEENPGWNAETRMILSSTPAGWRALALIQAGEPALAEAELRRLNPQSRAGLSRAMLALAQFVPMPGLVHKIAGSSEETSGLSRAAQLYSLPSWSPQNGFEVDRALIYALARHESRFDPDAISVRGARGLLQIMPATAKTMDGRAQEQQAAKLFDPEYNLTLGQKYVRHLTDQPRIGNNLLLLLAAYNTGPGKVTRWVETSEMRLGKKAPDPLLFVESMPQRETRQYVARVMVHYWAYRTRLGEPLTSLRQLAEGKWPRLAPVEAKDIRQAESAQPGKAIKVARN
ncbi:MAG: lytic transglycosylase domain-containing protein [Alphaproteobacteria bacterium]|nr:lytic transglycosylase domain-containing protein [Alphaproteobacteria bacterium]